MEPTSRSRQKSRSQDTELSHASKAQHQAEPESLAPTHAPAPASAPAGLWYAGGPAVGLGAPAAIQPKVAIGPSGDAYEREAESVASQVVAGRNVSSISSLSGGMAQPAEKKEDKKPEQKKDDKKPAQKLAQRAEKTEDKKPEQKKDDKKPAQKLAQRAEKKEDKKPEQKKDDKKPAQKLAQRAEKKEDKKPEQKKDDKKPAQKLAQRAEKKEDKKPEQKKDDKKPAQKLAQRAEKKEDKKPEQKKDDKKPAQKLAQRAEKAEEPDLNRKPDSEKILQRADGTAPTAKDREQDGGSRKTPGAAREGDAGASRDMEATATRAIDQKSPGEPLAPQIRQTLEKRMGVNLEEVRVHRDEAAQQATKALGARAFTHGNDIWLGPGESATDMELVAHEVTHVVQQGGGMRQDATEPAAQAPKAPDASRPASAPAPAGPAPAARPAVQKDAAPSASQAKAVRADATKAAIQGPSAGVVQRGGAGGNGSNTGGNTPGNGTSGSGKPKTKGSVGPGNTMTVNEIQVPTIKPALSNVTLPKPNDRPNDQAGVWRGEVEKAVGTALTGRLSSFKGILVGPDAQGGDPREAGKDPNATYFFSIGNTENYVVGKKGELTKALTIPRWGPTGEGGAMDVDHIREIQLGGSNTTSNMQLLDASANRSSGSRIHNAIKKGIQGVVDENVGTGEQWATAPDVDSVRAQYTITITNVLNTGGLGATARPNFKWDKGQTETLAPLDKLVPLSLKDIKDKNLMGDPTRLVLFPSPAGGQPTTIKGWKAGDTSKPFTDADWVKGYKPSSVTFDAASGTGTMTGKVKQKSSTNPKTYQDIDAPLNLVPFNGLPYSVAIDPASVQAAMRNGIFKRFSPITFSDATVDPAAGIVASGTLAPSLSVLEGVQISLVLSGGDIAIEATLSKDQFKFPGPIKLTEGAVTLSVGTGGVELSGSLGVAIDKVGAGVLTASLTPDGVTISGDFNFDSKLFDPAKLKLTYTHTEGEDKFSGTGDIGIPAGKVKGIKSANVHVEYADGKLTATGDAQPDIPGVTKAGVAFSYSEAEGMTISGDLALADIPGLKSGSVHVGLHQSPAGEYEVSASGTAEPNIPGINTSLSIAYEAGALTIEGSVQYSRGLASGTITVGATNRPVGEDGVPSGAPTENFTLYGGGELTLKLAPWLQATAGVKLLPNGELEIHGSIALPDALDLFPEKKLDKNLLSVNLDIPIVGVSVLGQNIGIFATIGGGLDLSAGIGPGQLQDLHLDVTYNPSHPDDAHVSGGAKLHVPAQAGLRLFVTGALGAGIPVVSARAGLEVGGQIGLEGALDASLNVDWTPSKGFSVDALGEVSVQPKFKFDITGFVTVEADLLLDTVELYSKRWQLASYEYGSDLKFGVKFPIHYKEGEPFDISLSDVEFVTPDVDPGSVLRGLISEIA